MSVRLATRKGAFVGQIYHWKSYKFKRYEPVRLRVPGDRALEQVSFFFKFFLLISVDLWTYFSRIQCLFCGVEPRWKANCQRQWGWNHQDLGLAIWRSPVDPEGALEFVSFFSTFCLSASVDSCADFSRFQGLSCGVEPRWKANCQRQLGWNHQDLGLAIWRLPVDPDRALATVSFFMNMLEQ